MIRQTITCDTCGIERKQANHWFEAFEHEGELRIRGLLPTKTTRPGLKHLCGQTCLHRLVDDFLAGNLSTRMFGTHEESRTPTDFAQLAATVDKPEYELGEFESSARLIVAPAPQSGKPFAKPVSKTSSVRTRKHAAAKPVSAPSTTQGSAIAGTTPSVAASTAAAPVPVPAPSSEWKDRSLTSIPTPTRWDVRPPTGDAATTTPDAAPTLSLQSRRAQAWERERARERQAATQQANSARVQKLL